MKTNNSIASTSKSNWAGTEADKSKSLRRPVKACRELSMQVTSVKNSLVREFGTALSGKGQLLKSALNEAEALAWQTPYPYLVFPVLAQEKASAVSRWAARQRSVQRASREMSLAE